MKKQSNPPPTGQRPEPPPPPPPPPIRILRDGRETSESVAVRQTPGTPDPKRVEQALRRIGMALCACNHCVTTDIPGTETDETHWRIDHGQELQDLKYLRGVLCAGEGQ